MNRLKRLADMMVEKLAKFGQYEDNCACIKGQGASIPPSVQPQEGFE